MRVDSSMIRLGGGFLFLSGVIALIWILVLYRVTEPAAIRDMIEGWGALAPIAYVLAHSLALLFALPSTPFLIASGTLFGPVWGTVYGILGVAIGGSLAFLAARYVGRSTAERLLRRRFPQLDAFSSFIETHPFLAVVIIRVSPMLPHSMLNFALGLTRIRFPFFVAGSVVGALPAIFVIVYAGDGLATFDLVQVGIALTLAVLFFIGYAIIMWRRRRV